MDTRPKLSFATNMMTALVKICVLPTQIVPTYLGMKLARTVTMHVDMEWK